MDVSKARELLSAATPVPWAVDEDAYQETLTVGAGTYTENPGCYTSTDAIYEVDLVDDPDEDDQPNDDQRRADAALITFAVNNLGPLLDEVERLRGSSS